MADLAITNVEKLGKNESVPTMLLSEAFSADGTENMREQYGEYKAVKGRLQEFYDAEGVKIKTPLEVYDIVSMGGNVVEVVGDATANLNDGDTIRVNGSTETDNNITFVVDSSPTFNDPNTTFDVVATVATQADSGSLFVGTTPIIEYHRHVGQEEGIETIIVATAYHVFIWSYTDRALTLKFTSATPANVKHWSIVTHLDDVYLTNNVDLVQFYDTSTGVGEDFADLGSASGVEIDGAGLYITKARFLTSFKGYLFLCYVTYSDSEIHPLRVHWSTHNLPTDFESEGGGAGDAGRNDFNSTPDFLVGAGRWGDNLIIFKQQRHLRGTLVTDATVFSWIEEELKVGAVSQHAIVNDREGRLYWLASDISIREIRTPFEVSGLVEKTIRKLNVAVAEFAQMTFIDSFGTLNLAIAIDMSETNNKLISFDPDNANSLIMDIPVRAFGDYTRQATFTYDTLPYSTYAEWGAAWVFYDNYANTIGFPLDIVSDYNGDTFSLYQSEKDDSNDMTRTFIFNTRLGSIFPRKRVNNGMYGVFRRQDTGTVSVFIQEAKKGGYTSLGTMTLTGDENSEFVIVHLPFDVAFQSAKFKFTSTDRMEIVGFIFRDFEIEDDR